MTNRLRAALALLLAALVPSLPATARNAGATTTSSTLPAGNGEFTFDAWQGPPFKVFTFVPEGIDPATAPILIVMHGVNRDADRYLAQWRAPAQQCGFIAIVPEFARSAFPTSREYNLGHLSPRGETALRPRGRWSFAAIEPLFDAVVAKAGGRQQGYTLYGHSAGSQFVHRFLLTQRNPRAHRFIAANAGWYTLPTFAIEYPFGLGGTDMGTADLKAALAADTVILLGTRDTDSQAANLNTSKGAMMQGKHRFARGQYFYGFGKEMARREGWEFGWSLRQVPGIGHDNGGMARAAGALVTGAEGCAGTM
jgi:poly(3-hydroxybutyrate) depolymerase